MACVSIFPSLAGLLRSYPTTRRLDVGILPGQEGGPGSLPSPFALPELVPAPHVEGGRGSGGGGGPGKQIPRASSGSLVPWR